MPKSRELISLEFLVLYRQFLLGVIDLEALSIQADTLGFLGQFAGVLLFVGLIEAIRAALFLNVTPWQIEQSLISTTMLVVGLITVISWDATFPDRRDVMVLAPLPVEPYRILLAKVAASATLLGLAVLSLNVVAGLVCPLILASEHGAIWRLIQSFPAYWFTMAAASAFLYSSVLAVQGFTALLLPRRLFLGLSVVLQFAAFGLLLGAFFLQPDITSLTAVRENHSLMAWSPSYWFFGLYLQLNGSLPIELAWLARRAWMGLAVAVVGAVASLLLCYLRTMRKTVEEPDLVAGAAAAAWTPRLGGPLQTAIAFFCMRSLTRSRQHRVAFAFYLALVVGIALSWLKNELSTDTRGPLPMDFLLSTFLMMSLAVFGLRSLFSLPISLNANWVLRITQIYSSEMYIAATRRTLLLIAVAPVWLVSAVLSAGFRPWGQVGAHLILLALVGYLLAELGMLGFYKVPFTCSYLPGKSNVQFVFWGFLLGFLPFALVCAEYEHDAFHKPFKYAAMTAVLLAICVGLRAYNRHRAQAAVLYFEELPAVPIMGLGL